MSQATVFTCNATVFICNVTSNCVYMQRNCVYTQRHKQLCVHATQLCLYATSQATVFTCNATVFTCNATVFTCNVTSNCVCMQHATKEAYYSLMINLSGRKAARPSPFEPSSSQYFLSSKTTCQASSQVVFSVCMCLSVLHHQNDEPVKTRMGISSIASCTASADSDFEGKK